MEDFAELLLFYLPLGILGLWRWGTWLMRRTSGWAYKPTPGQYHAEVSVVTPVYMEDPAVFRKAIQSWAANKPTEIIAVIDAADERCIAEFKAFGKSFPGARLIVTEKPGKRPALADGARAAKGDIIAFADSDTVWAPDLLEKALPPFAEKRVGGVATRQSVLQPSTASQRLFDIQLDLRFWDDMMPSAVMGNTFTCLSGRTALYRREAVLPLLDDLVNETFWGKQCIGGDDKRLTYLVEAAGWGTRYQHTARVYTPGAADMGTLFRQRTRWSRNSWRADLRAIGQGWVWKHPFLSFILVDRFISNLTLLFSLSYFFVSLALGLWLPALILAVWWLLSRSLRLTPNLAAHPENFGIVPLYIITNFALAFTRIFALFSLNCQDWITRGLAKPGGSFGLLLAAMATSAVFAGVVLLVYSWRF